MRGHRLTPNVHRHLQAFLHHCLQKLRRQTMKYRTHLEITRKSFGHGRRIFQRVDLTLQLEHLLSSSGNTGLNETHESVKPCNMITGVPDGSSLYA